MREREKWHRHVMVPGCPSLGAALALVALLAACSGGAPKGSQSPAGTGSPSPETAAGYRPVIDPANFVAVIDNPYLPLGPGTTFVYRGTSDGETEVNTVRVTRRTKVILGVTCVVVEDTVEAGGELAEKTLDWFAQDREGNVWYFGEDSKEYEGGKVVSTAGSWLAGVDGAKPGIVMKGSPRVGDVYRQEYYPGEAEDMGEVLRLDERVTVEYGSFDHVLVTKEWTPLEPGVVSNKYYARGVGLVMERLVEGGKERLELVQISKPS